jgi:hypothetical protein
MMPYHKRLLSLARGGGCSAPYDPRAERRDRLISIKSAREHLNALAEELEEIRIRLLGIRESLPSAKTPRENDLEAEPDVPVKIRAAIDCVLADSIGPALRDLRAVAKGSPGGEGDKEE